MQSSVRFLPPSAEPKTHHRFPSSSTEHLYYQERLSPIPRPSSTHLDNLPHRSHPSSLSHDSSSSHQLTITNPTHLHPSHHHHNTHQLHQQYHHHQAPHLSSQKPRPSSISKIANPLQQQTLRPSLSRTRTQSLTEASAIKPSLSTQRSAFLPHPHSASSRTPSPSSSSAHPINSIASVKKILVDILDRFVCPLEDKLLLVAKLHAEVEAELTQLSELSVGPSYTTTTTTNSTRKSSHHHHHHHDESVDRSAMNKMMTQPGQQIHSRKGIEDMVRLIKHADRIKAHALQQLKHDLSTHAQPVPHPLPASQPLHHPIHTSHATTSSGRVALPNRTDLH